MKKLLPLLALLLGVAFVASKVAPPRNKTAYDLIGFGRLPMLANGRVKPMDTLARSSLLVMQGRQRISSPGAPNTVLPKSPTEWLLDVFFRPEKADTYRTFSIDNTELLAQLGKTEDSLRIAYSSPVSRVFAILGFLPGYHRRFAYEDLAPHLKTIDEQAKLADATEAAHRNAYQRAVIELRSKLVLYQQLKHALVPPGDNEFLGTLLRVQGALPEVIESLRAQKPADAPVTDTARLGLDFARRTMMLSENSNLLVVPPTVDDPEWRSSGAALMLSFRRNTIPPTVLAYAGLGKSWREQKPEEFNKVIELFHADLARRIAPELKKSDAEARFNAAEPFYTSMSLYVVAFFLGLFSWLRWADTLGRSAFWLILVAWLLSTAGIGMRMWLEGRPPVTNLYSSALFIGWGAVAFCLVLERLYKNGVGNVAAGVIGFGTLLIAHHLSLINGDTLEMMQAVLDSNFWLATHVVVITAGYSATFLAGFLALIYIFRGLLTRSLDPATADSLQRMVYGIVCFATLFSLVGTILGGIWADQSWGRFWGWDPKENGALMIVIWNAVILHARWGGLVKARGLMLLAVGGNIVTSWSWFGTNMLGVGLHSYGFMDKAFWALLLFVVANLAIIALALAVPTAKWRSFKAA
jgi:ABC-type transport system involved in cytochrome c biogenesis permease subunit